jgi:large subunit ribosomal protein L4
MKVKTYNQIGQEVGTIELPERVFGAPWNADLVHQVVVSMEANARTPVAHVKDRSEVRGGGRKPWKQKGTGNARHGSIRSPLWRGGGATFGPRNDKIYTRKINKKMRSGALFAVLSQKLRDGEIMFVDKLDFSAPKTAEAKNVLKALSGIQGMDGLASKKRNATIISLGEKASNTIKSFNNFGNVEVLESRNLNPVKLLKYKYLVLENPEKSLDALSTRT